MGFFYSVTDTVATGNTENNLALLLTAPDNTCCVWSLVASTFAATAGFWHGRLVNWSVPDNTFLSTITPQPRDSGAPAAVTAVWRQPGVGSGTRKDHIKIGSGVNGEETAWYALRRASTIMLEANGGANGNLNLLNFANTGQTVDYTIEMEE